MCLFQLFVASSRLEILFPNEPAGASLVALPPQEKIDFKTSKLSTAIWGIKSWFVDLVIRLCDRTK